MVFTKLEKRWHFCKRRERLTEFGPESMSDLVLLQALYYPKRIALYPEILHRRLSPDHDGGGSALPWEAQNLPEVEPHFDFFH